MSSELYAPAVYPQDKSVCILVGGYQLYTKHGGDTFLQNVDKNLQEYTASQSKGVEPALYHFVKLKSQRAQLWSVKTDENECFQGALMLEVVGTSETSVIFYETVRHILGISS